MSARVPQIASLKYQVAMATSSKPLSQLAIEPASANAASANEASDLKDKFIDAEAQWRIRERTLHEEVCLVLGAAYTGQPHKNMLSEYIVCLVGGAQ